jgi:hypothetical protein
MVLRWASPDAGSLAQRRVCGSALASSRYAAMAIILAFPQRRAFKRAAGLSDANPEDAVCHFFPDASPRTPGQEPGKGARSMVAAAALGDPVQPSQSQDGSSDAASGGTWRLSGRVRVLRGDPERD